LGKPEHYVRAIGAGLGAAVVGGVMYAQVLAVVRFGSLILAGVLGYLIGRVVRWGARGQSQPPFGGIAIALAVAAMAVASLVGYGTLLPANVWGLLAYPIAGFLALRGLQS
jgi:hypothetical protein